MRATRRRSVSPGAADAAGAGRQAADLARRARSVPAPAPGARRGSPRLSGAGASARRRPPRHRRRPRPGRRPCRRACRPRGRRAGRAPTRARRAPASIVLAERKGSRPDGSSVDPVLEHGAAERHQPVRRLRVRLLAQEVHERVAPAADLVDLGGDGAQLALRADLVEVHRQRAQQLLGDEVDGTDVGVQEARDVALEEVGVGDVDAAQPQLHVERRRQPLVERRVGLDDVHPAADLGQVVRVDDRLPLVGGAAGSPGTGSASRGCPR